MIKDWFIKNSIHFEMQTPNVYDLHIGRIAVVKGDVRTGKLFNEDFELIVDELEMSMVERANIQFWAFEFGGVFYYTPVGTESKPQLNVLRWVGTANVGDGDDESFKFGLLGVHGRYELMSGMGDYSDWCKKAKFFKHRGLGICELNTLGGTLPFQLACQKAELDYAIGEMFDVESSDGDTFRIKVFALSYKGWRSLLKMHTCVNVRNAERILDLNQFEGDGCAVIVLPSKHVNLQECSMFLDRFDKAFYQFDTTEYSSDSIDRDHLLQIKRFKDQSKLTPILAWDAFCLDQEDVQVRESLKQAGKVRNYMNSENEYYKSLDFVVGEMEGLFKDADQLWEYLMTSLDSTNWIFDNADFAIDTKSFHLPTYEMTPQEEVLYGNNVNMFYELINDGMSKIDWDKYSEDEVLERIAEEIRVIELGGFVDYFLILWDIIVWCNSKGILTGIGRGSAGGSLVSYVLGIIKLNPLDYGLLFERFLNEGRIKGSLPDIDTDFESDRRDEVIEYMTQRYGADYVCRLGTYGSLQTKGIIQEFSRVMTSNPSHLVNMVTVRIEDEGSWDGIFRSAVKKPMIKRFVEDNPDLINACRVGMNCIKNTSVHACGTLIVPKVDKEGNPMTIYDWMPVRKGEDGILISEWEGDMIEKAGFLKEDILSTRQMTKVSDIIKLVEKRYDKKVDIEAIDLADQNVLELFRSGQTGDVFHFGSPGLTKYSTQVQPVNIEELISMIALYRPGAMISKAHEQYVKLKEGKQTPEYDFGLEEVTKDTFGLYIYQEQIMKAVQVLGGFDLVEADNIRKAMGKKIKELLDSFKVQFIQGARDKGCPEIEANAIWDKMEVFSGYGFNKSHAAAYAITGYICNWLKYYYPLEFWTIAFQHAKDDEKIMNYISEIRASGAIKIMPADINKSEVKFESDPETNTIYWSINKVKNVGPAALRAILGERQKGGKFFDMEEFLDRVDKTVVNKSTVLSLIASGAFDILYKIEEPHQRMLIVNDYLDYREREKRKDPGVKEKYADMAAIDWTLLQRELSQLAEIPYEDLFARCPLSQLNIANTFQKPSLAFSDAKAGKATVCGGIVVEIIEGDLNRGRPTTIILDHNYERLHVKIFPGAWFGSEIPTIKDLRLDVKVGDVLFLSGKVKKRDERYDLHNYMQVVGRGKGDGMLSKYSVLRKD